MAFPTLTRNPLKVQVEYRENKVGNISEDNYVSRRPRVTRDVKKFIVDYDLLPTTDRDALITHFESVGLHTSFSWTDNESNNHTVYYDVPLKFARIVPGYFKFESLELREA